VGPTLTIQKLVDEIALASGRNCFLVLGGTRVTGLITINQICSVPQAQWSTTTVGRVMVPLKELDAVSPDADLFKVFGELTEANLARLPVMENGQLVGMIGFENIDAFLQTHGNS
jgi:signal-transduction protein with cAMP-binding, CBS, and nucleotidyltransferase domain